MKNIIEFINKMNPDILTIFSGMILIFLLLFSLKFFKKEGLQIYICVALIACNIQVMKASIFFFSKEPVPLGTLTYGTISIGIAIIAEFFGFLEAKKAIVLGFLANIIFNVIILITLGYKPVNIDALQVNLKFLGENHNHMVSIFSLMPSIFFGGIIAYICSEYVTAFLQSFLKKMFKSKFLMIRTYFANVIGAFIDLMIMNYLTWFLFNPNPISQKQIFISYVLAAYPFRLFSGLIAVPAMFFARMIMKNKNYNNECNKKNT